MEGAALAVPADLPATPTGEALGAVDAEPAPAPAAPSSPGTGAAQDGAPADNTAEPGEAAGGAELDNACAAEPPVCVHRPVAQVPAAILPDESTMVTHRPLAQVPAANLPDESTVVSPRTAVTPTKRGISHVFTCGERRWTYHMAGPQSAPRAVQQTFIGHRKSLSWSFPPAPIFLLEKKKLAKKRELSPWGDSSDDGPKKQRQESATPHEGATGYPGGERGLGGAIYPGGDPGGDGGGDGGDGDEGPDHDESAFVNDPHQYPRPGVDGSPRFNPTPPGAAPYPYQTTGGYDPLRDSAMAAMADEDAVACSHMLARLSGAPKSSSYPPYGYGGGGAGSSRDGCSSFGGDGEEYPSGADSDGSNCGEIMLADGDDPSGMRLEKASRVPRCAPISHDPLMSMVCMCQHEGCNKIFAHADGCRKHCRKWHTDWLLNLDRLGQRCFRWERAWREGILQYTGNRHGAPLPLHVLVTPPPVQQFEGLVSLLSHQPRPHAPTAWPAQRRMADTSAGCFSYAASSAGESPSPARPEPAPRRAGAPKEWRPQPAKEGPSPAGAAVRGSMAARPSLSGGARKAAAAAANAAAAAQGSEGKGAGPALKRVSIAEAAAAARPGAAPKRKRDAKSSAPVAVTFGEVPRVSAPEIRSSKERGAHDALLPHGATWSMRQIEWFVGTWWKHLANASVATFETTLSHFSTWAADEHGLESIIAWLPRTVEYDEDLVTLQCLELLEYAELQVLPPLGKLAETVRELQFHHDKQVAETAERVTTILEEFAAASAQPPREAAAPRGRKASVMLEDYETSLGPSRGRGRGGRGRGRGRSRGRGAAAKAAEESPAQAAFEQQMDLGGYGAIDDGYVPPGGEEEEEEWADDGPALGCVCGTDRHLQSNGLAFAGVWVQCELCQRWCHGECSGTTQEELEMADFYHCVVCKPAQKKSRSGTSGRSGVRKAKGTSGAARASDIDEKLWAGAASTGWTVQVGDVDPETNSTVRFVHVPTGKTCHSRTEAVLHAALEGEVSGQPKKRRSHKAKPKIDKVELSQIDVGAWR